jgi:hypothetical protein
VGGWVVSIKVGVERTAGASEVTLLAHAEKLMLTKRINSKGIFFIIASPCDDKFSIELHLPVNLPGSCMDVCSEKPWSYEAIYVRAIINGVSIRYYSV